MVHRVSSSKRSFLLVAALGVAVALAAYLLSSRQEAGSRAPLAGPAGSGSGDTTLTDPAQELGQRQSLDAALGAAPEEATEQRSVAPNTIGGRVTGEDGTFLSSALVEYWPLAAGLPNPEPRSVPTDGEGLFELPAEPGLAYALRASQEPAGWGWAEPVFAGEFVTLKLRPGATLRVQVLAAPDRNPLEAVTVYASYQPRAAERVVWTASAKSGADGWATIPSVPQGHIALSARIPSLGDAQTSAKSTGSGEIQAELLFVGGVTITGRVLNPDGDPVPGTQVGTAETGSTVTAADGTYALPPSRRIQALFGVHAQHPDYAPTTKYLSILEAEDTVTCNFTLRPACSATGRVVDMSGASLSAVEVLARGKFSAVEMTAETHKTAATTNGLGEYSLTGLAPDATYALQVTDEVGCGFVFFRTGTSGSTSVADLVIGPAASLHGRVYLGPGMESRRPKVALRALPRPGETGDPRLVDTTPIGPQGNYAFPNLPAGSYSLSLNLAREGRDTIASHIVALAAGERRSGLDFDLTGARKPPIGGRVIDIYGRPIPSLKVLLHSANGVIGTCDTDAGGTFGFHASPSGKLSLEVSDPKARFSPLQDVPVELESGSLELTLQALATASSVSGTITNAQGAPVTGVYIALIDSQTGERHGKLGIADDSGRFQILNLKPTPYILKSVDYSGTYEAFQIDELVPNTGPVEVRLKTKL